MKRHAIVLAAALLAAGNARAALDNAAAQALMQKDGCSACHAIDRKVVGPAYQDVAAKYKGDKDALAKLSDKVKKGGSGVWGPVPMPPNAQVSDADIKTLVGWILALKK
ncbi:MAG TPA: c-type cytochrome [Casimicrobiaceae bacterium]|jgi:cytochrome c|nr:c-type cytochrome [Casimicrobiaceae bacterium]